jgi:hypothetical protein
MLITCFAFCFEMWNVIEKCDFKFFLLQKFFCEFVFVIMLNHLIVYVSIIWLEFFRHDECFDENDSSNMTKAIYQTWYERHLIISDKQHLIKLDEMYLVKSHQTWYQVCWLCLIKFWWTISHQTRWRLIKFDNISSNSTRTLFVFSDERFWVTSEDVE